jgi:nitric oxide synthase-interacting protein
MTFIYMAINFSPTVETGGKRKQPSSSSTTPFSFSSSQVAALAAEAEEAALKQIEAEQALAAKAKLPDFWLPSLTPTFTGASSSSADSGIPQSLEEAEKKMELAKTMCRGGGVGAAHAVA